MGAVIAIAVGSVAFAVGAGLVSRGIYYGVY